MSVLGDLSRKLGLRQPKKKKHNWRVSHPAQHPDELPGLLKFAHSATSYLEVGVSYGATFNAMVRMMPKGARGVAVDLPGARWGGDTLKTLEGVADRLRSDGYDIELILGDSTDAAVIERVRSWGPYDVALIDGDHLYEGVKADWLNYGPMAKTVIFHDIAGEGIRHNENGHDVEVNRLWQEICNSGANTEEIIGRGSIMGLGIVFRSNLKAERIKSKFGSRPDSDLSRHGEPQRPRLS